MSDASHLNRSKHFVNTIIAYSYASCTSEYLTIACLCITDIGGKRIPVHLLFSVSCRLLSRGFLHGRPTLSSLLRHAQPLENENNSAPVNPSHQGTKKLQATKAASRYQGSPYFGAVESHSACPHRPATKARGCRFLP